jgi:Ig-like domain from next to BRCA1 gene
MGTRRLIHILVSICMFLMLASCGRSIPPVATNQPAVSPPTALPSDIPEPSPTSSVFVPPTLAPTGTPPPTITPIPPCTNMLTFVSDVTIPDNTIVTAGSIVDKQWRVKNNGTCDWDGRYRLRAGFGTDLGLGEQSLYPARAGSEAVLRIVFTAPLAPGTYSSTWQAVAPDGSLFGDIVIITIIVQ